MAEEKTFECVFGYGDCMIRALIIEERQQSMMMVKSLPLDLGKDVPEKAKEWLNTLMQAMIGTMSMMLQATGDLTILGHFCTACPKANQGKFEAFFKALDVVERGCMHAG